MKIPMPKTSDWKSSCGSWEGFCKTVRKSIAKNLGSGIIKFNKMTNHQKIIELNKLWYNLVACEFHKDRDCHFYIITDYQYGEKVVYTVQHVGYINHSYEDTDWDTIEEAEVELIKVISKSIINEIEWYLEHYGDPNWDQHPRYDKDDLEEIITRTMLIAGK